jgi:Arginase family
MVVAHIIGRGAPELVRFWGESPLVREPDVTLLGLERVDPPEQEFLTRSPMRHIYAADIRFKGGSAAARNALAAVHADAHDFVLHLDLDVITNGEFSAVNLPDTTGDGLSFADVRAALREIARHKNLLGITVSQYNPDKDPDGSAAKKLVELLASAISARLNPEAGAPEQGGQQEAAAAPEPEAKHEAAAEAKHEAPPATEPTSTSSDSSSRPESSDGEDSNSHEVGSPKTTA